MRLWRIVVSELLISDAYPVDWYRWMGGQAGHALLIGVPMALIALALGCPPTATPLAVAAVYLTGWEVIIQRSPDWCDSAADAWHVGCGAGLVSLPMIAAPTEATGPMLGIISAIWIIWTATILRGISRRISNEGR